MAALNSSAQILDDEFAAAAHDYYSRLYGDFADVYGLPFNGWKDREVSVPSWSRIQGILRKGLEMGGPKDNLSLYEYQVYLALMQWIRRIDKAKAKNPPTLKLYMLVHQHLVAKLIMSVDR